MKKLLVIFIFISTSLLNAQHEIQILLRRPVPPKITDWQRDPTILNVIVNIVPTAAFDYYISLSIEDGNGKQLIYTKNDDYRMPKFNSLQKMLNGSQVFNFSTLTIGPSIKAIISRTNLLPEGDYQLCAQLLTANRQEFGARECIDFTISIPDPPILMYPLDGDTVNNLPQFSWTPVTGIPVKYKVFIAPVFRGQNGRDAIERNRFLLNDSIFSTTYQYLPSNQPFNFYPDAVGFAWQIQAVDMFWKPRNA